MTGLAVRLEYGQDVAIKSWRRTGVSWCCGWCGLVNWMWIPFVWQSGDRDKQREKAETPCDGMKPHW